MTLESLILLVLPVTLVACGAPTNSTHHSARAAPAKVAPNAVAGVRELPSAGWINVIKPLLVSDIAKYHIPINVVGVKSLTFGSGRRVTLSAWKLVYGSGIGDPFVVAAFSGAPSSGTQLLSYLVSSFDEKASPHIPVLVKPLQIPGTNTAFVSLAPYAWFSIHRNVVNICARVAVGPKVALASMHQSNFIMSYSWQKSNFHYLGYKATNNRDSCAE